MLTKHFFAKFSLGLAALLISACSLGQTPAATPTPQDISAVYTVAAETARAQLTEIASLSTPTLPPTATSAPTQAPLLQVTAEASPTLSLVLEASPTPSGLTAASPTLAIGLPALTAIPSVTPASQGGGTTSGPVCKNSAFIADVTIPDGTVLKPGDQFYKTWRMQNTGTCTWDDGFSFLPWAGPAELTRDSYRIKLDASKFVKSGDIIEITLLLQAPSKPGEYVAHYAWFDDVGKPFGGDFVVYIVVK
ncbi:MAG: hypothetical protein OHK0031_03400 [Anaerolineales bacterium]